MSVGDNADLKAVAMDKTGVVRITHDGVMHTIRRPKWGAYRRLRDTLKDLAPLDQARVGLMATAQDENAGPVAQAEALDQLLDLTDQLAEKKAGIIALMFNGHPGQDGRAADPDTGEGAQPAIPPFKALSDIPLPSDVDEWEPWILADESMLPQLLEHWRQVPLVPSARG